MPALAGLLLWAAIGSAQTNFFLKNNDRVVFYGDSITDQRLYTTFVETYSVTRFPKLNVRFVHSGWGGDRVTGGGGGPIDIRLQRDVIAYKPTVVTIMLGMNDAGYKPYDEGLFQTYRAGYEHIIRRIKSALPGVRITAIQPSPFDDVTQPRQFEGGYNEVLRRYGKFVQELVEREKLALADLNTPVVAALGKAKAEDAKLAQEIIPDRVHPGPGGHLLMAEALLKAWNAPALVTAVEIDARTGRAVRAENTEVTALQTGGSISWTQRDAALPMPVDNSDAALQLAVRSSDFVQALNQQRLKVTGLTAVRYALKIDGEQTGAFTREQLGQGINLADLATPMSKQAMAVHALTIRHNDVHAARWREVDVPLQNQSLPHLQPSLDALDALESELVDQQRAAAQPKPHTYELLPQ